MKTAVVLAAILGACAEEWGEKEATLTTGTVIVVDDDRVQCPAASFTTIQAAVDAAAPGDTVKVCAGTYPEEVIVEKTLTLLGAQAGRDARKRSQALAVESVVVSGGPFRLRADGIVVDGFYIHELFLGEEEEDPGVSTLEDFSGYQIRNNVFDSTTIGLFPRSSGGTETVIRRNLFLGGVGIATGEIDGFGATHNTLITENRLLHASIILFGADDDGVRIIANTLIDERMVFSSVHLLRIEQNKILHPPFTAISIANASAVVVRNNMLRDGESFGIGVFHATDDVQVLGNRIAGFQEAGILLDSGFITFPTTNTLVSGNEVEDNGVGVALGHATDNVIIGNNVEDNVGVSEDDTGIGIQVGVDAAHNLITGNEARGNTVWDCRDQSSGDGTLGTANTWEGNEGSRSSPDGLCPDQ